MAATIDMEEERVLALEDVVSDYDKLYELLLADEFENITKWDGETGQYPISQEYKDEPESFREDLNNEDEDIEWYIDDKHFVIVIFHGRAEYNEYAISLQQAKDFLQKIFLREISWKLQAIYFRRNIVAVLV